MTSPKENKYFAFISYKEEDYKMAKWLQHKVEHYHLPSITRKKHPDLPQKIKPVFEYKSEMAGGFLKPAIKQALDESKYLIVICSPNTPQSHWVAGEVQHFIDEGRTNQIIPFVVAGEAYSKNPDLECFPKPLKELKEPLRGIGINEKGRDAAAVKVVAQMFELDFDELWQRYKREQKSKRLGIVLLALIAIGIAGWIWLQNVRLKEKNWKMMENQSKYVAEKANSIIEKGDFFLAQRLLIEALPEKLSKPNRPYTIEAELALRKATVNIPDSVYKRLICMNSIKHTLSVRDGAGRFSPDGKFFLSAIDSNIQIWDVNNNCCVDTLFGHKRPVKSVSFSPNGREIISTSQDGTIKIWSVQIPNSYCTNSVYGAVTKQGNRFGMLSAMYSPDGNSIVSIGEDGFIKIWDTSLVCIDTLTEQFGYSNKAFFSPDGINVVVCNGGFTYVWDIATKNCKIINGTTASYSNDGKMFVTISNKKAVVWDRSIKVPIDSLSVKSSGSIVYFDESCIIQENNIITTMPKLSFKGHSDCITTVSYKPDGKQVITASYDKTVRIWDTSTGKCIDSLTGWFADYTPDGKRFATINPAGICIWDADAFVCIDTIKTNTARDALSFFPDGKKLVVTSRYESNAYIWDIETKTCIDTISDIMSSNIYSIAFYHDKGQEYLSVGGHCWNTKTYSYDDDLGTIINTSPDEMFVLKKQGNRTALFDTKEGKCIDILFDCYFALFSPDGKRIILHNGIFPGGVSIWDSQTKSYSSLYYISCGTPFHIYCFSPNNQYVLVGSENNTIFQYYFPPLQDIIEFTRKRFESLPLTDEERRTYFTSEERKMYYSK